SGPGTTRTTGNLHRELDAGRPRRGIEKGRRHQGTRPYRRHLFHRLFRHLHGRQFAAGASHQRRDRPAAEGYRRTAAQRGRLQPGRVGAHGLRRLSDPHLLAQSARVLSARTPLAPDKSGRFRKVRVKIFLYFIGKPKDSHANSMAADFMGRVAKFCKAEMREIRPERTDLWGQHPTARKVLLDPGGRAWDSAGFAALVRESEMAGRDLVFAIGGHDGLPPEWRDRADLVVSLGSITLPHELARVVLAEQIYRAFTMLRG